MATYRADQKSADQGPLADDVPTNAISTAAMALFDDWTGA
jgi:hypothetical protein